MIIGVDIDNVIADTEKELRRVINDKKGINLTREDITSYSLENIAGIEREDLQEIFEMFNSGDIFLNLEVMEGAQETLELLTRRHKIILVTSRPERVEGKTRQWLSDNAIPYHELMFASETKVNGVPYELFIEDQDKFAFELAEEGSYVLLYDAPWNRHVMHDNINRVYSWQDVHKFCFPPCATGH